MNRFALLALVFYLNAFAPAHAESGCESASTRLLDALDRGDYTGATTDFNDTMKTRISADKLSEVWQAVPAQFGARGEREAAQVVQNGDKSIVVTPLHYGTTVIDAQVTCSADGKIAGFYIKPHQ